MPLVGEKVSSAVVLAQRDGRVVAQNTAAHELLGSGIGQPCWDFVGRLAEAKGLPCNNGCVGRLLLQDDAHAARTQVTIDGRFYELHCVRAGEMATCVLRPSGCQVASAWEHLTAREREILFRIANGETTRETATALGIRDATVRTHVERMREKLGVPTRAALVARGFKLGLLG